MTDFEDISDLLRPPRLRIRFQDKEWLLIGDLEQGGAIATKEAYENGEVSYAHLVPDGRIFRYNKEIGDVGEIEVLGLVTDDEVNLTEDAWDNLLFGDTWEPK